MNIRVFLLLHFPTLALAAEFLGIPECMLQEWVKAFLKLCASQLLGFPAREQELGERFLDWEYEEAKYLQVLPPSTLIKMLRECGFRLLFFNTSGRIEGGKKWGFPGHFEDGERFYVAEKC